MGNAGRDALFEAQMATANQDAGDVGYFCLRCHVPLSFVTGHAYQSDGSTLDDTDRDGVNCHFCHAMVDPDFKPGVSPDEDEAILAALAEVPGYFGNSMFVLDPSGTRRGPREDADPLHELLPSPFHRTSEFCGTCHEVGNLAVSRRKDGTWGYNAIDEPTPDENPWMQFPLERTYTEWKLSAFADGGVDLGGRFGGEGMTVVATCQDCHMPRAVGQAAILAEVRQDLRTHDFAGAAAPILDLIAAQYPDDPAVDLDAIALARAKAVSMLERAADLELEQACGSLRTRVVNQTGHKLPTGHIEGRRVFVSVDFLDADDLVLRSYGHYDPATAHLDADSTEVYEMHVGLSPEAAALTGYPAGVTTHMALADVIEKDNRIPPRGFVNAAYEEGGAPVVGPTTYADGQHWDDSYYAIPRGATRAIVTVSYQCLTDHYVTALRDANVTDDKGQVLYDLWEQTGRGAPIVMATSSIDLDPFARGDLDCDADVDSFDLLALIQAWDAIDHPADLDGDRSVGFRDLVLLLAGWDR